MACDVQWHIATQLYRKLRGFGPFHLTQLGLSSLTHAFPTSSSLPNLNPFFGSSILFSLHLPFYLLCFFHLLLYILSKTHDSKSQRSCRASLLMSHAYNFYLHFILAKTDGPTCLLWMQCLLTFTSICLFISYNFKAYGLVSWCTVQNKKKKLVWECKICLTQTKAYGHRLLQIN